MRVGINATFLTARPSGAKNRFINIYIPFIKIAKHIKFVIFEPKNFSIKKNYKNIKNLTFVKTTISNEVRFAKIFYQYFYWQRILKKYKFDVFENFSFPTIKNSFGKTISTIHDLRFVQNFSSYFDRMLFKLTLCMSLNKNDFIFVVSNTIKNELSNFFPNKKIVTIFNSIPKRKIKIKIIFKKKFRIKKKYVLSVGHLEKRKNYLKLIESFKIFNKDHKNSYNLIIIGNDNGYKNIIDDLIIKLNIKNDVMIFSGITNEELFAAYKECDLFIFPSIYEGFGIPILEAISFSSRICLSNIDVFREIAKNKANYFDPKSLNSIVKTMNHALNKKNVFKRFYIQRFSEQNVVDELNSFYKKIL